MYHEVGEVEFKSANKLDLVTPILGDKVDDDLNLLLFVIAYLIIIDEVCIKEQVLVFKYNDVVHSPVMILGLG
jgi:hypothetical protein